MTKKSKLPIILIGLLFITPSVAWGDLVLPQPPAALQNSFWTAMSEQRYVEAGKDIDLLLSYDPNNQQYKFQKAEWLWESANPVAALNWLATQESYLDKNELVNFLNKMLPKFSKENWTTFYSQLVQHQKPTFSIIEATILTRELSSRTDARETFLLFKDKLLRNFNQYPLPLQFYIAVLVDKYGFPTEAEKLYQVILNNDPSDWNTKIWITKVYMRQKRYDEARKFVDSELKKDPKSYQLLLLKGELFETQKEFLKAVKVYNRVLRFYPGDQEALNLKMRALMDMGAVSLAQKQLLQNPQADPVLLQRSRGDMAMNYIRWEEPWQASIAMEAKIRNKPSDYERAGEYKIDIDPQAMDVENMRTRWDSMLVLFQKNKFPAVIKRYEAALKEGLDVPVWVLKAVADSYLFKREPEKALEIYQDILKKDPNAFESKIALYYTYVDLGKFEEARLLLETMDFGEPVQVIDRGILRDNQHKAEITYNKVWLLMYQDRLKKAHKIGRQYFKRAPGDIQLRSAMAHLSLWRGWPRQSLKEFKVIRTMSPTFISGNIGYARALYDNVQKAEARDEMARLYQQHPQNRHIARAKRLMDVDDMGLFRLSGYTTHEMPGADEFGVSARVEQPLNDRHKFFAELTRRETTQEGDNDITERFYVGDIYRPNNTWRLMAALSGDYDSGEKFGGIGEVQLTPDDYWTHTFRYDSRTIDVPLRSRAAGIDVQDYQLSTRYRRSESFNTSLSADFKDFEDGNENWSFLWATDSAIKTYARWKWRVGTEFSYGTFSNQDVDYYSPESVYTFYVIPNVEHVWFRRYERGLIDRFFVGLGQQWQKFFGAEDVGFLRYELEYRHSDVTSFTIGTIYSLRNYDGGDVNVLNIYAAINMRF